MKNNDVIKFSRREMQFLISEKNLVESSMLNSVLNKIKSIASKANISFDKLKKIIKTVFLKTKRLPSIRMVTGILVLTVSANAAFAQNEYPTIEAAVQEAGKNNNSIVLSGGVSHAVVNLGNKGFEEVVKGILDKNNKSKIPDFPQAMPGTEVVSNITFSNTKDLSLNLKDIWKKYQSILNKNKDLNSVHIKSEIFGKEANFLFVPEPENITIDELLASLKKNNIDLPEEVIDQFKLCIGEKTGVVDGFILHPDYIEKYGRWAFIFGKTSSALSTLLHEASHLFGIQKSLKFLNQFISKVEGSIIDSIKSGEPFLVDALVYKKGKQINKFGEYELKNFEDGMLKEDLINLIVSKIHGRKKSLKEKVNIAKWIISIGKGTGRIKLVKANGERRYIIVADPIRTNTKSEYYISPEETSRYEDSIKHFIENETSKKELSLIAKEILTFYKDLKIEKNVKEKIDKLKNNNSQINTSRELFSFRKNLIIKFEEKIDNNKSLSEDDKEKAKRFSLDVIFFIVKYYDEHLVSMNANNVNAFNPVNAEERLNSLGKLDNFLNLLNESKKIHNKHRILRENVYVALLNRLV